MRSGVFTRHLIAASAARIRRSPIRRFKRVPIWRRQASSWGFGVGGEEGVRGGTPSALQTVAGAREEKAVRKLCGTDARISPHSSPPSCFARLWEVVEGPPGTAMSSAHYASFRPLVLRRDGVRDRAGRAEREGVMRRRN
ncbi:hypothetical protein SKAU_G00128560 [Synaphobranchus kaupii]|uniref:Uncharacterized protein n=1 Tax=Synaphobranchus kaupii TaxID=118154 RepID=A0A9Q1J379_SYNKA|nr:hypothetical protein SKAU_G00128560 [Synaphobranchus kaupii]